MVASIVKSAPDVIISGPDRYTGYAFQQATKLIPIVGHERLRHGVRSGCVASLAHPGGNIDRH